MTEKSLNRNAYLSRNVGDFPAQWQLGEQIYRKVDDLRYGTNPHQSAAYYKPEGVVCPVGDIEVLKTGKSGLSQTNLEDISYALNIVKFFNQAACAVMKHVNPSGVAVQRDFETLVDVYRKGRDCDSRAAFGSTIAFNVRVDVETAREIMGTFVECVVAPDFDPDALAIFQDQTQYKLNAHIRILRCGDLKQIPRYTSDESVRPWHQTVKVLCDGSVVLAAPLLTGIRSIADLRPAQAESKALGSVHSTLHATPDQLEDLLAAWYVNLNVRSNGVVIMKKGQTLAVGTGEQDRVGAVEQAIEKYKCKYEGFEDIQGAVMASDGFFPFPDAVEVAATAGISAIIAPSGSLKDAEVITRANALGVALYHAPERIFSHH